MQTKSISLRFVLFIKGAPRKGAGKKERKDGDRG